MPNFQNKQSQFVCNKDVLISTNGKAGMPNFKNKQRHFGCNQDISFATKTIQLQQMVQTVYPTFKRNKDNSFGLTWQFQQMLQTLLPTFK